MSVIDTVVVALAMHAAVSTQTTVGSFTVPVFMRSLECAAGSSPFDRMYGLGQAPGSLLYGVDYNLGRVLGYDAGGHLVAQWGQPAEVSAWGAHSVAVMAGEVYVTENLLGRVVVFSSTGAFRRILGPNPNGDPGFLSSPTYLCPTPEGTMLVSDSQNMRIVELTAAGERVRTFGSIGSAPGQLGGPRGIAIDGGGRIYVADEPNRRVSVFTREGVFLFHWLIPSRFGIDSTPFIRGIHVDGAGLVYVTDVSNCCIHAFDTSGALIARWGSRGTEPGQLSGPNDIEFDDRGRLAISQFTCSPQWFARDAATRVVRASWGSVKASYR